MRFAAVYRIVFRKELRELLRDRRSLFWLFAPPIILPGLAICAGVFIGTQAVRIAQDGFPVVIENPQNAPELVKRIEESEAILVVEPPLDPAVDPFGQAVIIVSIPETYEEELAANGSTSVQMLTKDNSLITLFGKSVVRGVVEGYSRDLLNQRLEEQGLTPAWLNPVQVIEGRRTSTATSATSVTGNDQEEGSGNLLATIFLPLAVTSWLLGGGMGLVLDTTVGEKDRQTIENLLVTPASRVGIVMGKMTVVFIASMLVMALWLAEGLLLNSFSQAGPEIAEMDTLNTTEAIRLLAESSENLLGLIVALLILIIPFTIMLNALVMGWCAYAANYREANLFMALVQLGLPASVLLTIFSLPPEVGDAVYAIPFFGTIVAIRDLFSDTLSTTGLLINAGFGLVYAMGAIFAAAWIFGREWSATRGLQ